MRDSEGELGRWGLGGVIILVSSVIGHHTLVNHQHDLFCGLGLKLMSTTFIFNPCFNILNVNWSPLKHFGTKVLIDDRMEEFSDMK